MPGCYAPPQLCLTEFWLAEHDCDSKFNFSPVFPKSDESYYVSPTKTNFAIRKVELNAEGVHSEGLSRIVVRFREAYGLQDPSLAKIVDIQSGDFKALQETAPDVRKLLGIASRSSA
jgi:hypothetical protein